jgi:pyruvate dehydrogenase (quinone)
MTEAGAGRNRRESGCWHRVCEVWKRDRCPHVAVVKIERKARVTVSDFLIHRLNEWNIRRIYGFPGDGINGIIGAIGRAGDKVDYVQVRHEEMAAFMACAHSKFTGEVGVCLATSGPGAIHLLNGLYDAKMDHQSVLAIVGQQARMAMGGNFQQEIDLVSLFKDVAGDYVHMATVAPQIRHLVDRAVRIARAERTVTCLIVPNDLQELPYEEPPRTHGALFSGVGFCGPEGRDSGRRRRARRHRRGARGL